MVSYKKYEMAETSIFGVGSDTTLEDWTMARVSIHIIMKWRKN